MAISLGILTQHFQTNPFVVYLKSICSRRWFHTHCWSLMVVNHIRLLRPGQQRNSEPRFGGGEPPRRNAVLAGTSDFFICAYFSISIISSWSFPVFFRRTWIQRSLSTSVIYTMHLLKAKVWDQVHWFALPTLEKEIFGNGINLQIPEKATLEAALSLANGSQGKVWWTWQWQYVTIPKQSADVYLRLHPWNIWYKWMQMMDAESMWSRGVHEMDGIWMGFMGGLLSWFEQRHTSYHCSSRSESGSPAVNSYSIWMLPWATVAWIKSADLEPAGFWQLGRIPANCRFATNLRNIARNLSCWIPNRLNLNCCQS